MSFASTVTFRIGGLQYAISINFDTFKTGKVLSVRKLMDIAYCRPPMRKVTVLASDIEFLQIIGVDVGRCQ